ncbi:MAG TPA: acyl-CoA dehydrogenase [Bacillales bacterium]|nr:acyl-CoA dehydrogenase [Bacillales bacterium]
MDLHFTREQEMMRKMVRDFAEREVVPSVQRMDEADEFPVDIVRKMGELGLMGIPVAEEYGGAGMDLVSYMIAIHELSRVSASVGVILSVHTSLATNPICSFGTREQKQRYAAKLASGECLGAFALTEPGSGSDAGSLATRAKRKDGRYVLNGSKMFVTNGETADIFIVFARTDPESKDKGISAFVVERGAPGLSIGKKEKKMGLNGSGTVEVIFEDAEVPAENLLGREGEGFKIALANLDTGRIGIAAQSLGIAEAALEYASAYAKERKQFGRAIGQQQAIAFKLADMATEVEAAKLLVYRAATMRAKGLPCGKEASMAKLFASTTARKTAIEAVQVFGGYGYTKEFPVERLFRDAKVTEIYEGTSEIQRLVISKKLLAN